MAFKWRQRGVKWSGNRLCVPLLLARWPFISAGEVEKAQKVEAKKSGAPRRLGSALGPRFGVFNTLQWANENFDREASSGKTAEGETESRQKRAAEAGLLRGFQRNEAGAFRGLEHEDELRCNWGCMGQDAIRAEMRGGDFLLENHKRPPPGLIRRLSTIIGAFSHTNISF